MDDRTLTIDTGDNWEDVIVGQARGELWEDDDEVDDTGDDEPETLPVITALLQIKNIVGLAIGASDAPLLEAASTVQNLLQGHCIRQTALAMQKTIRDFFKTQ